MASFNDLPIELILHVITLFKPKITVDWDLWRVALVNKKLYGAYLNVKYLFTHRITRTTFNTFKSDIAAIIVAEQDPTQLKLRLTELFARYHFPVHIVSSNLKRACRRCKEYPVTVFPSGPSDSLIWCPRKNLFLTKHSPQRAHAYGWEWEGAKRLSSYSILSTREAVEWLWRQRAVLVEYIKKQRTSSYL